MNPICLTLIDTSGKEGMMVGGEASHVEAAKV
jgi:hypothetical protein